MNLTFSVTILKGLRINDLQYKQYKEPRNWFLFFLSYINLVDTKNPDSLNGIWEKHVNYKNNELLVRITIQINRRHIQH